MPQPTTCFKAWISFNTFPLLMQVEDYVNRTAVLYMVVQYIHATIAPTEPRAVHTKQPIFSPLAVLLYEKANRALAKLEQSKFILPGAGYRIHSTLHLPSF
jgi:hypothetical protein